MTKIWNFLGLAGYYRKFVEGFSKLATPLTKLKRKEENLYGQRHVRKASMN